MPDIFIDLERRDLHISGKTREYFIALIASELVGSGLKGVELVEAILIELRILNRHLAEIGWGEIKPEDISETTEI